MVKSYFSLYKNAKKLLDEDKVILDSIKTDDADTYYFLVDEHRVTLKVSKNGKFWERKWECDCTIQSLFPNKNIECVHVVSAVSYLVSGGLRKKGEDSGRRRDTSTTNDETTG